MNLIQSIRNVINGSVKDKEIIVPIDNRSITVENSNGANVSKDVFPLLSGLRNNFVLGKAGCTVITGANSDINISKFTGNTAKWKGETEKEQEESNITFDGITLKPYRLTSFITLSNQLLMMDSNGANETLKQDLLNSIFEKLEETIFGNEEGIDKPEGLFYGIDQITPISYNEIVEMEEELDNNNVPNFNRYFIISPSAKSILRKTKKESGGKGRYVLEKQKIQSIPTLTTNSVIENGIVFGDFEEFVVAVFGHVIITVDPYSNAINDETKITINFFVDAKPRRNECFVKRIIEEGQEEPKEPEVEITGHLRGKFTNDSTEADWWYYKNGSNTSSNKVNISEFVDPITHEFEVDLGENNNTLAYLFSQNKAIERIDEVPLGDVSDSCQSMFSGCSSLQSLSNFNPKNVTNMYDMFYNCTSLSEIKGIENWNTERTTDLSWIFYNCTSLQSLDLSGWKTENVTDMTNMFAYCSSLQSLLINFTIGENTTVTSMFGDLSNNFTTIQTTGGLKICNSIGFTNCRYLTNESVMVIINALEDRSEKTTKTLTLYRTQFDELTPEQLAIATSKNWTVVRW